VGVLVRGDVRLAIEDELQGSLQELVVGHDAEISLGAGTNRGAVGGLDVGQVWYCAKRP
jgi:hypothetical protein